MRPAKVELPIADPPIYGYQFYGFPLAIHYTDPRTEDWVLSNFIALAYDNRGQNCDVPFCFYVHDYAQSPWLELVRGTRSWYRQDSITEVIRDALANDYYAYAFVDEYHIPNRERYQVMPAPHDILVHGYDDDAGTFDVLGYDERIQFRSTRIPIEAFERGYAELDENFDGAPMNFWKLRSRPEYGMRPVEYPLDTDLIKQTFEEHLASVNTSNHFRMLRKPFDCTFGMATYAMLADYLATYCAGEERYDQRHLHVLWEHKRLMVRRFERLAEVYPDTAYLVERAAQAEELATSLRLSMIRHRLTNGRSPFAESWPGMLGALESTERSLLEDFLKLVA